MKGDLGHRSAVTRVREAVEKRLTRTTCKSCEAEFKKQLRLFFTEADQQGFSFEQRCKIVEAYARNKRDSLEIHDEERNVK